MISRLGARLILSGFVKIEILHRGNSRQSGGFLLAANHISHFDPPLISVAVERKLDWMAMAELFESKIFAAWARWIDTFPTNRFKVDRASVKIALDRLKRGHGVGIFPEGGIRDGDRSILNGAEPLSGIGAISHLSDAPIVPCVILGSDRLYNPKAWNPFRRARVWIGFGAPLRLDPALAKHVAREKLEAEFAQAIRSLFGEMRARYQLTEEDLPQNPGRRKGRAEPDHPHKN